MVGDAVVLEVTGAEIHKPKSGSGVWASLVGPWIRRESLSCRQHSIESKSEENASMDDPEAAAPMICKKASGIVMDEVPFKENLQTSNLTESCYKSLTGMEQAPSVFAPLVPDATGATFQSITAALHSAASAGHTEAVAMLLAAGASPSCPTADGATPLHRAARHGHIDTVRMLLDAGARSQRCDLGFAPLDDAAYEGHHRTVRLLLERKASISGTTPLDLAAHQGHEQTVGELLTADMWPVPHNVVETLRPLQLATLARHHAVVKLLLQRLKHFLAEELEEQK